MLKLFEIKLMLEFPTSLQEKLQNRIDKNSVRKLSISDEKIDFSSNDYIGFSRNKKLFTEAHQLLFNKNIHQNGATGSRLLSGNSALYIETEEKIANFHNSEAALIYNSGYDANIGLYGAILHKNDVVLYDEYIHSSIRDGIKTTHAKAYKFKHNDVLDLEKKILFAKEKITGTLYVTTETVFSMDGDCPDIEQLILVCKKHKAYLIMDEAHALAVFGEKGEGLLNPTQLKDGVFASVVTFGKGLGCHGAAVLCSEKLKSYLINFSRSFIYTTALSPHSVATIQTAYRFLEEKMGAEKIKQLHQLITHFNDTVTKLQLDSIFIKSNSAIHCCIISGNKQVKAASLYLQNKGYEVKAIVSPTVPEEKERLRFCLHSYNTETEISGVLQALQEFIKTVEKRVQF